MKFPRPHDPNPFSEPLNILLEIVGVAFVTFGAIVLLAVL